jgi:hypothetical protein
LYACVVHYTCGATQANQSYYMVIWWVLGIIVNDILKKYFSFKIILKYFLFLYF